MTRLTCFLLALTILAASCFASGETLNSPGIGPLPPAFVASGGLIIDMLGANGKRLTAQISPASLAKGYASAGNPFLGIWNQTGFDSYTLQTLLGGGLQQVNLRITMQNGESASPNPVYVAIFGANTMPYSGPGIRCPQCLQQGDSHAVPQPPGWDFDAGTNLYIAIQLSGGGYINCGYMGQTTTYQLDAGYNTLQTYTGFPGTYAIDDYGTFPLAQFPRLGYTQFPVTGWFSVPSNQLAGLYNTLLANNNMTVGMWAVDPGNVYYDFTQGVANTVIDIPLLPPEIVSFVATPLNVVGSGTVTLSWQTVGATSLSIDHGVTINATQLTGSVDVPISTGTKFTLSATGPGGTSSASVTVGIIQPLSGATTTLPNGVAGSTYNETLTATGGTTPYGWRLASGTLPPGLSLAANGTISGTPTAPGTASFMAQVLDSSSPTQSATLPLAITITPPLSVVTTTFPNPVLSAPYIQPISAAGGTPPYLWTLITGTLPPGLALGSTGSITGTPTAVGTSAFTLKVLDSTTPTPQTLTQSYTITVGSQLSIQTTTLATTSVGNVYSQTLVALGGTTPYTWSVDSGPLPAGLTLSPAGVVSGSPSAPGLTTLVIRVTDATAPTAQTTTQMLRLYIVDPLIVDTLTLPDGTAAHSYAQPLNVHDGIQPYVWTVNTGPLPPGLQLLAPGALIGTPTATGTYTFSLKVSDSSIPLSLITTQTYTVHISPAFVITTTALPGGSTGIPYTASVQATDGNQPYNFAIVFGNLPPGLALNPDGTIGGSPSSPGTYNLLVRATDSTSPAPQTADQALVVAIDSNLAIVTPSLADATESVAYSQTLTAINGMQPYTWTLATGTLPPGLLLLPSGVVIGTPTKDGAYTFTIQASDSTQPTRATSTRAYTINVALPLSFLNNTLPNGIIDAPYTAVLTTTGGIQPYIYTLSANTSLPPGLSLSSIGVITGAPTTAGTFTFTISVQDSGVTPVSVTKTFIVAINVPLSIPATTLPQAAVGTLYTQQLSAIGGMTPYAWTLSTGPMPPGLSLLTTGVVIGTPTKAGTYNLAFTVQDSTPAAPMTAAATFSLTVVTALAFNAQTLPRVLPNVAYLATFNATGGVVPYLWQVSAGQLPAGLNLGANGTISGTTTAAGSYPITITVTDNAQPQQSVDREFVLLVDSPFAILTTSPLLPAIVSLSYSQPLAFNAGLAPLSCSVLSGSLPAGLTLAKNGTITGQPSAVGAFQFIASCQDAGGQTALKPLTLAVQPALSIVAGTIPPVVTHSPYFRLFQLSGGTGPFLWTVSIGNLPPGLTLTTDGLLTGIATTTGAYPVTLSVTDSSQPRPQAATLPITLNVSSAITALSQHFTGVTTRRFDHALSATGGVPPLTWTIASGSLPPGLSLSASAEVTGTPSLAGPYGAVLNITDTLGDTDSAYVTFSIADALAVPALSLPSGTVSVPYSALVYATGGTQPYTWTIASGTLPPGLLFSVGGGLTGTPTAAGAYSFQASVTAGSQTAAHQFTVTIAAAPPYLVIPPSSAALPPAYVGIVYRAPVTVAGAQGTATWKTISGSLPPGITVDPTGSLAGTPTTAGTYSFALSVQDSANRTTSNAYALTVSPQLAITTNSLTKATIGTSYAATLAASGGLPPYNWTASQVPAGLILSKTGVMSGTPTTTGAFAIILTVVDSMTPPLSGSTSLTLTVGAPLTITTAALPPAMVGTPYNTTLTAANNTGTSNWAISNGSLPAGLSLTATGSITGTPTQSGSVAVLISLTDASAQTVTKQLLLTVADALSIVTTSVSPFPVGTPVRLALVAKGGAPPYSWTSSGTPPPAGLAITSTGIITGTPSATATATVTIVVTDSQQHTARATLLFTVSPAAAPPMQLSPNSLTLQPSTQTAVSLTLVAPSQGPLTGHLAVTGSADQALAFLQSGNLNRSIAFIIAPGSTTASFPDGAPLLQSGTVASTITLTATVENLTGTITTTASDTLLPLVPTITAAHYQKTGAGFDLIVDGYSTTREIQSATFRFYGINGSNSAPFTQPVTAIFTAWYNDAASAGGGTFSYRQSFNLTGDLGAFALKYAEVSLTNSVGTSATQQILPE